MWKIQSEGVDLSYRPQGPIICTVEKITTTAIIIILILSCSLGRVPWFLQRASSSSARNNPRPSENLDFHLRRVWLNSLVNIKTHRNWRANHACLPDWLACSPAKLLEGLTWRFVSSLLLLVSSSETRQQQLRAHHQKKKVGSRASVVIWTTLPGHFDRHRNSRPWPQ